MSDEIFVNFTRFSNIDDMVVKMLIKLNKTLDYA